MDEMCATRVLAACLAAGCSLTPSGEGPVPGRDGGGFDATVDSGARDAFAPDAFAPDAPALDTGAPIDAPADVPVDSFAYQAGYALRYNGSNSFVDMGNVPIPGNFTLEAWVFPYGYNGETYVAAEDQRDQAAGQFRFGMVASGQLFFTMSDGSGNTFGIGGPNYAVITPGAIPTNTWTEVAVTKSNKVFTLLVNGAVAVTFTAQGSFVFNDGGSPNPFRVGARVDNDGTSPNGVFSGVIDEVRFWNAPRTSTQIGADMSHELDATDPDWSTIVNYWRFDEGTGTSTVDRVGGHNGTLTNGPAWVPSTAF
jgi:concanavalin A-like lectin/glucanase superfamily protein